MAFPNPEVERGYDIECVLLDYGTEAGPVLVPGSRSGDGLSKEDLSVIRNFLERYAPDSEGEFGDPEPVDSNRTKDSDNERVNKLYFY